MAAIEPRYKRIHFTMEVQDAELLTPQEIKELYAAVQDIGWDVPVKGPQISTGMTAIPVHLLEEHRKKVEAQMAALARHNKLVAEAEEAMKTRHGFVSNSSSSSFVMGVPKGAPTKIQVTLTIDLADFAEHKLHTVAELDGHYIREYGHDDTNLAESDEYNAARAQIEKGNEVWFGSFSSESDRPEEVLMAYRGLKGVELPEELTVISGEGYD
jgi:hypothetical protein